MNDKIDSSEDKLQLILGKLFELSSTYKETLNPEYVIEILEIVFKTNDHFLTGISSTEDFTTFEDIEQLILEAERQLHDANLKNLFRGLKRIPAEKDIVAKKKPS
ncbi:MAG: hypothetical protein LBP95_09050 [Deltaproteobacteria bacterium]|jgi:hypothetical protein|nr:hypothetical protein [Deltaproteobacteria bacterium]